MAHFMGIVAGGRGEASRLGSAMSGIRAQAQGWDSGVKVYGSITAEDCGEGSREVDQFQVVVTGGSNGATSDREIARVVNGRVMIYVAGRYVDLEELEDYVK